MGRYLFLVISLIVLLINFVIWYKNWDFLKRHWRFVLVFTIFCLLCTLFDALGQRWGAWGYSSRHTLNIRFLGVEVENFIAFPASSSAAGAYIICHARRSDKL